MSSRASLALLVALAAGCQVIAGITDRSSREVAGVGASAGIDAMSGGHPGAGGNAGAVSGGAGKASGGSGGKPSGGGSGASLGQGGTKSNGGTTQGGGSSGKSSTGATGGASGTAAGAGEGGEGGAAPGAGAVGGVGGTAGTSPTGGAAGTAGSAGTGVGGSSGMSGCGESSLPPTTASAVPKPTGTQGNLTVLDWAGFTAAISFTFDDSLQSQLDAYPMLNAIGVPMTFYDVCANDGSKAGWAQAAADGHELGNHTMHHCEANGTSCGWGTFSSIDAELDDCTAHIESAFGVSGVYTMAAPNGDNGWQTAASQRFLLNRGVYDDPGGVLPNDATNPYALPCHIASQGEPAVSGFNVVIDSAHANGSWRIILNHSLGNNDGYNPVDPAEVAAAMTHAKGLGDVWVDTVISIGAYWRAQKTFSTLTPVSHGADLDYSWTLPDHFPPGRYLRVKVDGGTVKQCGSAVPWNDHGYYEIALDAGALTVAP